MWPGGSKDPGACREVEEGYCWRVQGNVEPILEGSAFVRSLGKGEVTFTRSMMAALSTS